MLAKFDALARRLWGNRIREFGIGVPDAKKLASPAGGPLAEIFFSGRGRRVHKWVHYLPVYERYFSPYRQSDFKFLEIGVFGGGSLDMWREFFGPAATIFGVDINPSCKDLATPPTQVRIGSQDDSTFLRNVVSEMGGLDVVLDDGSHVGKHQRSSFETLFPLLSEGGIYMIEDTHTSYWRRFGGGYRRRGTAIEFGKRIIDDLHGWYHGRSMRTAARDQIGGIHFHDSIIVIEKQHRSKPGHVVVDQAVNGGGAPP
jgi:methyltransferase family protein